MTMTKLRCRFNAPLSTAHAARHHSMPGPSQHPNLIVLSQHLGVLVITDPTVKNTQSHRMKQRCVETCKRARGHSQPPTPPASKSGGHRRIKNNAPRHAHQGGLRAQPVTAASRLLTLLPSEKTSRRATSRSPLSCHGTWHTHAGS